MISACFDKFVHVGVADAELFAIGGRRVLDAHALAGLVRVHHALLLGAALAAQDRGFPARSVGL